VGGEESGLRALLPLFESEEHLTLFEKREDIRPLPNVDAEEGKGRGTVFRRPQGATLRFFQGEGLTLTKRERKGAQSGRANSKEGGKAYFFYPNFSRGKGKCVVERAARGEGRGKVKKQDFHSWTPRGDFIYPLTRRAMTVASGKNRLGDEEKKGGDAVLLLTSEKKKSFFRTLQEGWGDEKG